MIIKTHLGDVHIEEIPYETALIMWRCGHRPMWYGTDVTDEPVEMTNLLDYSVRSHASYKYYVEPLK